MRDKSMTTLQEFKNKQLEILHELDRVCNKAGINYYLAYGTCLGAVPVSYTHLTLPTTP